MVAVDRLLQCTTGNCVPLLRYGGERLLQEDFRNLYRTAWMQPRPSGFCMLRLNQTENEQASWCKTLYATRCNVVWNQLYAF
jgi:hypothetical protein